MIKIPDTIISPYDLQTRYRPYRLHLGTRYDHNVPMTYELDTVSTVYEPDTVHIAHTADTVHTASEPDTDTTVPIIFAHCHYYIFTWLQVLRAHLVFLRTQPSTLAVQLVLPRMSASVWKDTLEAAVQIYEVS